MGGIAGVLGGAANPLAQYGQQVRGLPSTLRDLGG